MRSRPEDWLTATGSASAATVEREQPAEDIVVGNLRGPTVRGSHSRVKGAVRIDEPLRPGVVRSVSARFLSAFTASSLRRTGRFG